MSVIRKMNQVLTAWSSGSGSFLERFRIRTVAGGVGAGLKFIGWDTPQEYASGRYEWPLQNLCAEILRPGDVFYDIGANFGFFSILAARLVGAEGRVYAFEPIPRNASRIRRNAQLNTIGNLKIMDMAISDRSGFEEIWLTKNPGGATLLSTGTPPPDKIGRQTVETARLDDVIDLRPPMLIKIDVEGAEIRALRGMAQTLKRFLPPIIYEIDDGDESMFHQKAQTMQGYLEELGYRIAAIETCYPQHHWRIGHFIASPSH